MATEPLAFLPDIATGPARSTAVPARVRVDDGRLPLYFEPNRGQTATAVQFLARGPGYTLFLTADEAVLALRPPRPAGDRTAPAERRPPADREAWAKHADVAPAGAVVRMRFAGSNRHLAPTLQGLERLPGIK